MAAERLTIGHTGNVSKQGATIIPVSYSTSAPNPSHEFNDANPVQFARDLIVKAKTATLATLDLTSGHPYASLVTVAIDAGGAPLLLLSNLALHTRNARADARASLLFQAATSGTDPLAGARVTVVGELSLVAMPENARARFLARHPDAAVYAGFADFAFYVLKTERAHFIGGFGRIVELGASDLLG